METLVERVRALLANAFEGCDVSGVADHHGRVLGCVVWDGFGRLDHEARQELITDRVRRALGGYGVYVGILIGLTPEETHADAA
ncbi:MAG: hypothetical protein IT204_25590 [Fimbriimonadaceae bacterium]|nr:hypothetical protein [Fimbriimonadaceae bacterium]